MTTQTINTAALSTITVEALTAANRAELRNLFRAVFGQPSDRKILDRSTEMRAQLQAALESLQTPAPVEPPAAEVEVKAEAPAEEKGEKKERGSKWTQIVEQLWALRESPDAVEVKVPVEKMVEMCLPTSATTHPAAASYWNQNPPGLAARKMGLVTSLRKGKGEGEGRYLLIRKAGE